MRHVRILILSTMRSLVIVIVIAIAIATAGASAIVRLTIENDGHHTSHRFLLFRLSLHLLGHIQTTHRLA